MRFFVNWLLAITFIMPASLQAFGGALAQAPSPSARARVAVSRITQSSRMLKLKAPSISSRELSRQLEVAARENPKEAMVGVGHTLLFIMVLAGIDLTAQEVKRRKDLSVFRPDQMASIITDVTKSILDSPQIWMGIIGAGGLSVAQKPAIAMANVFTHPSLRPTLGPLLARAISATIAFVGWEFGSQLWVEASLRLESDADYRRANSAIGLSGGLFKTALMVGNTENRENARVAKLMMREMVHIVLNDSNLRAQWFDNTWRLRILTGEFSTMLTAMIAAGAIGTAVFPGAGTLAGMIFGLTGGVVAMFLPQGFKDDITGQFQNLRFGWMGATLAANSAELKDAMLPKRFVRMPTDAERNEQAIRALVKRRTLRAKAATIPWERMHLAIARFRTKKITQQQFDQRWTSAFAELKSVYNDDLRELTALAQLATMPRNPANIRSYILVEINRVRALRDFTAALEMSAQSALASELMLQFVEINRSRGVNENESLQQWLAAQG